MARCVRLATATFLARWPLSTVADCRIENIYSKVRELTRRSEGNRATARFVFGFSSDQLLSQIQELHDEVNAVNEEERFLRS